MIRTNMYFPKQLYELLKSEARREEISIAELVRNLVEKGISKRKRFKNGAQVLLEMAKHAGRSGLPDLARNHDEYLYGSKRIK